jgi:two-component system, NtrC family, sensor kinase
MTSPVSVLIVEDDRQLQNVLAVAARTHGYNPRLASTVADAVTALDAGPVHVALVDLILGPESGLDAIRRIKDRYPDAEIVVVSATTSVSSAIESYELHAFAFVQKPFDLDQLFATVHRAIERRRMNLANRRLMWELQLINDIGDELRQSLDPRDLLVRALQRLIQALDASSGGVRLLNSLTGQFEDVAVVDPAGVHAQWSQPGFRIPRPSDRALETRQAVRVDDLSALVSPEIAQRLMLKSALSVPLLSGAELLGTLSIGSSQPHRFTEDDERLMAIIAGQVGVAVQNARLHSYMRVGKQQWEATFDAIGDPIAVFDGCGRLLRGNTALAIHLNRPVTTLRDLTCDEVGLCGGTYPHCAVGQAAVTACTRADVTLPDARIFSVTTCPVEDVTDEAAVVQIAKNVTLEIGNARRLTHLSEELAATNGRLLATVERLKATQAQLLQAEKLSAIGQLVAGVAHELNNPLTSVIGYAQLVEGELRTASPEVPLRPPVDLARDVRRIAEESERAARIVRNLLAFARRQTAERAPQDIADIVSRVLALRAYEFRLSGIELESTFDAGLPRVLADAGQLQQALLNLVLNAEQAMRGRVPRRLCVGARYVEEAAAVELVIGDTGHGIAEENLRRIFDPFFTTRDVGEGTGLGLSICYGIVRDHGGQIRVESRVGVGTTFSLLLPARPDSTAVDPPRKLLVAHGDPTERDYITAILGGWGHQVVAAEPGDVCSRLRAGAFDAAFIDHSLIAADLPAWRSARVAEGQRAALVLITSTEDEEGSMLCRDEARAILAPPLDLRALRAALRAVSKECV